MAGDLYRVVTYIFRPGSEELFGLKPGFCIMSLKPASAYDCGKARDAGRVRRLKCWPHYFDKIRSGEKDWELRADDRVPPYEVGDVLEIYRFEPTKNAEDPAIADAKCKAFDEVRYACRGFAPVGDYDPAGTIDEFATRRIIALGGKFDDERKYIHGSADGRP